MNAKIIICLFAALFAVQGGHALSVKQEIETFKSIQEIAEDIINALKGILNGLEEELKKLLEGIKNKVGEIIGGGEGIIQDIIAEVKAILKDLANKASEIGAEALVCIDEAEKEIDALPAIALQDMQACLQAQIDEAERIVGDTLAIITNAINKVTGLENDVKQCGINVGCITNVVKELISALTSLPEQIKEEVDAATALVNGIGEKLQQCSMDAIANLQLRTAEILANTEDCIRNVLP